MNCRIAKFLSLLVFPLAALAQQMDLGADTWAATDALGRAVPMAEQAGAPRPDHFVGIFYFLWHGANWKRGPYDIGKIFAADPEAMKKPDAAGWGPMGYPHYWGEPLFGYYRSDDPWVLRKHAQMLANAGVDTLIFDTTNAEIYRDTFLKLCEVFAQARRDGVHAPQIVFMVNTKAGETARKIFEALYKPGLFPELWFRWQGKPLLICDPEKADAELKNFFTLRRAHWPFEMVNTKDAWHWEAAFPQPYGFHDDPKKPEQVNVSVAQNLRASDGKVTNMSHGDARGRGFHDGMQDGSRTAIDRGLNCDEQWRRALQLDPPFVMVTGWNEWIAGRFNSQGPLTFVDQFNEEFSRDIEPMNGGHGDNYYYQFVAGIRRYKGARAVTPVQSRHISIDGDFSDWSGVQPEFRDAAGDAAPREFSGIGTSGVYTNKTGRNDIVAAKVSVDASNVYFYVRTAAKLSQSTDRDWMTLLIDADITRETKRLGFDHMIYRGLFGKDAYYLLAWDENHWSFPLPVQSSVSGNEIELAFPRNWISLRGFPKEIDFKWIDNIRSDWSANDFTLSGDAAPDDRFNYRARLAIPAN